MASKRFLYVNIYYLQRLFCFRCLMRMKFGAFLFKPERVEGFDFHVFRVKPETGDRFPPDSRMYSNIAVFADNAAVKAHPSWVSQSPLGPARAGNARYNFFWDTVCATQPEHQAEQLEYLAYVDAHSRGVWLNSFYFAEHGHCVCSRCGQRHRESGLSWFEWRRREVAGFVRRVRECVGGELVLCLQPDPVCSLERYGVDFDELARYADAFNVVMFSKSYATPWYWEMLSRAFKKLLRRPVYVSLYVSGPGDSASDAPSAAELLTLSVRCARAGVDGILYFAEGAAQLEAFQKAVVDRVELRERLQSYGAGEVQDVLSLVAEWERVVG
jgi:hypothetical protein